MKKYIRRRILRWLGVDALERRVRFLEREVHQHGLELHPDADPAPSLEEIRRHV